MSLNWSTISAIVRNELRMLVRDRRTIITSVVLPLVILPIVLYSASFNAKKRAHRLETTTYRFAVTGSTTVPAADWLAQAGQLTHGPLAAFQSVEVTNARDSLARGELEFIVEALRAGSDNVTGEEIRTGATPPMLVPELKLVFRADREESSTGAHRMRARLEQVRKENREAMLRQAGFGVAFTNVARVEYENLAPRSHVAGSALGRLLPLLILMFLLTGGAVVAVDLIAGEKERGTLETLLTSSARATEIAAAKILVVLVVALVICVIQTLNLLVYIGFSLIPVPENFSAAITPSVALLLFFLLMPMAALVAGVLLLTSAYARSYKEAQLYFLPVFLLGLLPGLAPMLPGIPLRSPIVLVPIANIAVAVKEVLTGVLDVPMLAASWLVTAAAAAWSVRATVRLLTQERFVTNVELDATEQAGGFGLFERQVLVWFGLLWAVLLVVNNYIATADLRIQITVNLVVLFLGTSLLLLRRYRLPLRETLALRLPKPMVWPAMLVFAPCATLSGIGLFRLAERVLPMPPEVMRAFSEALLPEGISFGQILFFLAVMPALLEEITFRGVLLHGLHRRMHPAMVAITVGLVFGVFHMALFRVLPTAWLGLLFAVVTLLTGSIYPAMLGHFLNNALGLLAGREGVPVHELEPIYFVLGALGLAFAFWVLWRHRTPYPGLRPWKKKARVR